MSLNRRYLFASVEAHLVDTTHLEHTPALCGMEPPTWSRWYGKEHSEADKVNQMELCTSCANINENK